MFGMVNNNTTDKSQHEKIVITGYMNEHIKKKITFSFKINLTIEG